MDQYQQSSHHLFTALSLLKILAGCGLALSAFIGSLVPELLLIAEQDERPVGFALTLPDVNVALRSIRGRLWPWSVATLFFKMRSVRTVRTITLGVLPPFRASGLDAALILESVRRAAVRGTRSGECSWMLEDNHAMIGAIRQSGGEVYRAYRVYERVL